MWVGESTSARALIPDWWTHVVSAGCGSARVPPAVLFLRCCFFFLFFFFCAGVSGVKVRYPLCVALSWWSGRRSVSSYAVMKPSVAVTRRRRRPAVGGVAGRTAK